MGPVIFLGAGAGFGGIDLDPSGVDTDDDEASRTGGITVPGLKFRENVEDFWGTDNGGATTTIFWEEEGVEGKTNEGTFVKVLDWLVEREWRESTAVEGDEEEVGKDDVDNDN